MAETAANETGETMSMETEPEQNPPPQAKQSEVETESSVPESEMHIPANAEDITPDKDGGVMKEIKRQGTGEDGPLAGDKVFVHYVGTLTDGTKFDSSRDRDELFEFQLGKGAVIKAWDLGVATMKRGELAVLYCHAKYAYGERGSPPKIPANACLIFEVELFDWKGEDLTSDKDGGILRSQIDEGSGYNTPSDGASCTVHVIGKHNGSVFEDHEVSFTVGEADEANIIEGIDEAIKKFKKGERSLLKIAANYAYGSEGHKDYNIPANTNLEYMVTLKDFEKCKDSWEMDTAEKLEQSDIMKQKGTNFFKQGKFQSAKRYYKKIIDYLEHATDGDDAQKEKRGVLMLAGHLNLAMCYLKLGDNLEAVEQCDKALEMDANSEKAFFRRGMAHLNVQDFEEAVQDFSKVLTVDPNNKAAKNQITIANQKIKQMKNREKQIYGGMFKKFADIDAKREESNPQPKQPSQNGEAQDSDSSEEEMEESASDGEQEASTSEGEKEASTGEGEKAASTGDGKKKKVPTATLR